MTRILPILPLWIAAASQAAMVTNLSGQPLAGVGVAQGNSTTLTLPNGAWSFNTTSVTRALQPAQPTSGLHITQGTLVLRWGVFDPLGRRASFGTAANLPQAAFSARSAAVSDTLILSWKGRKLFRITSNELTQLDTIRIDTAWSDDGGIRWNPLPRYGTLIDTRDGRHYRTLEIARLSWMAEDLDFAAPGSVPGEAGQARRYSWAIAMGLDTSFNHQTPETFAPVTQMNGICPEGWTVPDTSQWRKLSNAAGMFSSARASQILKATRGWLADLEPGMPESTIPLYPQGYDRLGFRALPLLPKGGVGAWWTFREPITIAMVGVSGTLATAAAMDSVSADLRLQSYRKEAPLSLRCVREIILPELPVQIY